jgi:hypothetical protein
MRRDLRPATRLYEKTSPANIPKVKQGLVRKRPKNKKTEQQTKTKQAPPADYPCACAHIIQIRGLVA